MTNINSWGGQQFEKLHRVMMVETTNLKKKKKFIFPPLLPSSPPSPTIIATYCSCQTLFLFSLLLLLLSRLSDQLEFDRNWPTPSTFHQFWHFLLICMRNLLKLDQPLMIWIWIGCILYGEFSDTTNYDKMAFGSKQFSCVIDSQLGRRLLLWFCQKTRSKRYLKEVVLTWVILVALSGF